MLIRSPCVCMCILIYQRLWSDWSDTERDRWCSATFRRVCRYPSGYQRTAGGFIWAVELSAALPLSKLFYATNILRQYYIYSYTIKYYGHYKAAQYRVIVGEDSVSDCQNMKYRYLHFMCMHPIHIIKLLMLVCTTRKRQYNSFINLVE